MCLGGRGYGIVLFVLLLVLGGGVGIPVDIYHAAIYHLPKQIVEGLLAAYGFRLGPLRLRVELSLSLSLSLFSPRRHIRITQSTIRALKSL